MVNIKSVPRRENGASITTPMRSLLAVAPSHGRARTRLPDRVITGYLSSILESHHPSIFEKEVDKDESERLEAQTHRWSSQTQVQSDSPGFSSDSNSTDAPTESFRTINVEGKLVKVIVSTPGPDAVERLIARYLATHGIANLQDIYTWFEASGRTVKEQTIRRSLSEAKVFMHPTNTKEYGHRFFRVAHKTYRLATREEQSAYRPKMQRTKGATDKETRYAPKGDDSTANSRAMTTATEKHTWYSNASTSATPAPGKRSRDLTAEIPVTTLRKIRKTEHSSMAVAYTELHKGNGIII